jgi:hypothetical protein
MTRAVLAALALLTIGAAAGISADRLLHRPHQSRTAVLLSRVQTDAMGVIDEQLDLRPEQRERVAEILERRQGAIDAVWRNTHIQLRATIDSVVNEIAAVLDSDQVVRFRTLADEVHGAHRFRH